MLSIGSILTLVATVAAETTTTLWLPDIYEAGPSSFVESLLASAVGKSGNDVTLAIPSEASTRTVASTRTTVFTFPVPTFTWIGNSSLHYSTTGTRLSMVLTYGLDCSIEASTKAVCVTSTVGSDLHSDYCHYYTTYTPPPPYVTTRVITTSNPPIRVTRVETRSASPRPTPSYCLSGSEIPENFLKTTYTVRPFEYPFIITAGEEKLSATTGASPSASTSVPIGTPNNSGAGSSSGSNSAPTVSSNFAGPVATLAPALAGLGAAAAAIFL